MSRGRNLLLLEGSSPGENVLTTLCVPSGMDHVLKFIHAYDTSYTNALISTSSTGVCGSFCVLIVFAVTMLSRNLFLYCVDVELWPLHSVDYPDACTCILMYMVFKSQVRVPELEDRTMLASH